jgi:hypothetical protein
MQRPMPALRSGLMLPATSVALSRLTRFLWHRDHRVVMQQGLAAGAKVGIVKKLQPCLA